MIVSIDLIYIRRNSILVAFYLLDSVWALTAEKMIHSLIGRTLEKPRRAQYLTQATFVPDNSSQSN